MLKNEELVSDVPDRSETRDDDPHEGEVCSHSIFHHRHHDQLRFHNMIEPPFTPKEREMNCDGEKEAPGDSAMKPIDSVMR